MKILYYITSHGYGHAVRSTAIANAFSTDVEVVFRCAVPAGFFKEEMRRPFELYAEEFDCGCIQTDSMTIDIGETARKCASLSVHNQQLFESEVCWCREQRIDCIVSDIVPFAFDVADRLGIPGIAVTNFTWYDIYAPFVEGHPEFRPVVDAILRQYERAGLLLQLSPSEELDYFHKRTRVPPVGRRGRDIRAALVRRTGNVSDKRIGLIYTGTFGMKAVDWGRLDNFTEWEFIGVDDLPGCPSNYHKIKKADFRYQDLTASVDVVISKLGYSTVAECMVNGTPILFLPRRDFSEYPVLERAVLEWGGGYFLNESSFNCLEWQDALDRAATAARPAPVTSEGARVCARLIEERIAVP